MNSARDILGFSVAPNMHRIMMANGFYAAIMRADKKSDKGNQGLPPGIPIPVLPVDYLKNRPDFWVGGQGSYVCPVDSDWALWFNWSMNNTNIAILTSVKGMNPLTGQRVNGLGLEQYMGKCPIHDVTLQHGKLCPECNFKWPDQNYITDPNPFYLDGFRSADGVVRQFYFTEDMAKSIPELVIGKDDTVPAFGFCFYGLKVNDVKYENGNRFKDKFPVESLTESRGTLSILRGFSGYSGTGSIGFPGVYYSSSLSKSADMSAADIRYSSSGETKCFLSTSKSKSAESKTSGGPILPAACFNLADDSIGSTLNERSFSDESIAMSDSKLVADEPVAASFSPELLRKSVRKIHASAEVGIGAGAKIKQAFAKDARCIDEWQEKPAGIIRVYFVFREQFERYVEDGLKDLSGCKECFMEGLPVGGAR